MMREARPTPDERIRAAIWHADAGWGIFPAWSATDAGICRCPKGSACTSPAKHPITAQGFHDATQDPERITKLLSAGSEPNYGMLNPDGVLTWDADGATWRDQLHSLEERLGPLPETMRNATAHGEHVFWRWPDAIGERPPGEMFGFVTRWGSGRGAGYVLGPLSVHASGVVYRRAPGGLYTVTTLPDAWATAALGRPRTGDGADGGVTFHVDAGYALPAVVAAGTSRYDAIVSYTAHLYNRGFSTDEMWDAVRGSLAARFAEPLPEADLRGRFDRAIADMPARLGERRNLPGSRSAKMQGSAALDDDDSGWLPETIDEAFPDDPAAEAFGGLIGEMVDVAADGTDASRVGLLGSLLAFCGALVPVSAYFNRRQTSSPYIVLVGPSSIGRKGTAMHRIQDMMSYALQSNIVSGVLLDGLNSGEALVSALAFQRSQNPVGRTSALVFEEEFARVLSARQREGSTLDMYIRTAFDGGQLSNQRSESRKVVAEPYWLPGLAAITPDELRTRMETGALKSGSGNRWLYLPVVRREDVALSLTEPILPPELSVALVHAREQAGGAVRDIGIERSAGDEIHAYGDWLPTAAFGLSADLTQRLAIIAFRVGLVHAGVERSPAVTVDHVRRGIALAEYARRGIPWCFGTIIGNPDARLLWRRLMAEGGRMARHFASRHVVRDQVRLQAAADELTRLGLARIEVVSTGAKPRRDLVGFAWQRAFSGQFDQFDQASKSTKPSTASNRNDQRPMSVYQPEFHENVVGLVVTDQNGWSNSGQNVVDLRSDLVDMGTDAETGGLVVKNGAGQVWCWYYREHSGQARDVATSDPWCEICTPKET